MWEALKSDMEQYKKQKTERRLDLRTLVPLGSGSKVHENDLRLNDFVFTLRTGLDYAPSYKSPLGGRLGEHETAIVSIPRLNQLIRQAAVEKGGFGIRGGLVV